MDAEDYLQIANAKHALGFSREDMTMNPQSGKKQEFFEMLHQMGTRYFQLSDEEMPGRTDSADSLILFYGTKNCTIF